MARRKRNPSDILERLRAIDALAADGFTIPDALRIAGLLPGEYEKWRDDYAWLPAHARPVGRVRPSMKKLRRARPAPSQNGQVSRAEGAF
jgi:hypothetical protein